jgi:hypothetical protein
VINYYNGDSTYRSKVKIHDVGTDISRIGMYRFILKKVPAIWLDSVLTVIEH